MTIIPAAYGYLWLTPYFTDDGSAIAFVDHTPIIAWVVEEDGGSRPVLAPGATPSRHGALRLPGGDILDDGMRWDGESEWREWVAANHPQPKDA
jgi:hypothetical protein